MSTPRHGTSITAAGKVLDFLRREPGREVSGAQVSRALGLSRNAVWKQVVALRATGYTIEAHPRRGYSLTGVPNAPLPTEVVPLLTTERLGRALHVAASTVSTNRDAAALADAGSREGTVVVAETQTGGRGRMARNWFSPPGLNLYFSVVLRPDIAPDRVTSVPLLAGCAVAQVLEQTSGLQVGVKWPNDILLDGLKLCGILCEMQAEPDHVHHVVVGIGLNVNLPGDALPSELRGLATSLAMATGRTFSRPALLAAVLNRLETAYMTWCVDGLGPFLPELAKRDVLLGQEVAVEQAGRVMTGRGGGIRADGALTIVAADGSSQTVFSGDAHVLRRGQPRMSS